MKQVYLIRHALPDFPQGEKMCLGTTDLALSEEGYDQARTMAENLPPVTAVFSSPLRRAMQTAQAIGKQVQVLPGLREYHMGLWDGLTFRQIRKEYPDWYEARGIDPTFRIAGEEDTAVGLTRFLSAMQKAVNESTGDIAVVAHGGVIAAFLRSLGGRQEKPGYAQVVNLTYDGTFHFKEEEDHA